MAMSNLTVAGISPELTILGPQQNFKLTNFNSSFGTTNEYAPASGIPSITNHYIRNNTFSGFRWIHTTNQGDTTGTLKLQSFVNGQTTGTDILSFAGNGAMTISGSLLASTPTLDNEVANKAYVDATAGVGVSRELLSTVQDNPFTYTNNFTPTLGNPSTNTEKYRNVYDGGYAFVHKTLYNDTTQIGDFEFNVIDTSGVSANLIKFTHSAGNPEIVFNATTIFSGMADFSGGSIFVNNPTDGAHASSKAYVDNHTWLASSVTNLASTVQGYTLNSFAVPTADLSLNSHKIINQADPVNPQDGATRNYVDTLVANTQYRLLQSSSTDNLYTFYNTYLTPSVSTPATNTEKFLNVLGGGYSFVHTTNTNTMGTFALKLIDTTANGNTVYTIWNASYFAGPQLSIPAYTTFSSGVDFSSTVNIVTTPTSGNHATNKTYVDTKIPTFRLDQFAIPTANLNINSNQLNNVSAITMGTSPVVTSGAIQMGTGVQSRKAVLWQQFDNDHQYHGFGVNASTLRYQVPDTSSDHVWYAGASSSSSNEVGRLKGVGDLVIPGTIYGRRPSGLIYLASNLTATTVSANTWTKVAGTTSSTILNQFTMSASNRLTYTGSNSITAGINVSLVASHSAASSSTIYFAIYKNGVVVAPIIAMYAVTTAWWPVSLPVTVTMATSDYVEVWCYDTVASNITVNYMSFYVTST